jgi:hypothetical protein
MMREDRDWIYVRRTELELRRSAAAEALRTSGLEDWPRLLAAFFVATLITVAPIALHVLVSQPIAILFCLFGAFCAARFMERDIPIVVLLPNIFQNTVAAMLSWHVQEYAEIEVLKSYSFLTAVVCWLALAVPFVQKPSAYSPFVRKFIFVSTGVMCVVGVYFVLGLAVNPRNATVYLRNIGLPILLFQMFMLVGARHEVQLPKILTLLLVSNAVCGYIEIFALDAWLEMINGMRYLQLFSAKRLTNPDDIRSLASRGMVAASVLDYSRASLFNTGLLAGLDIQVQRLLGPAFNTISFAYLLASLISLLAIHKRGVLALLALPLLIATSAKGPLFLCLACIFFYWGAKSARNSLPVKALGVILVFYAVAVFQVGYSSGDYHVIGLVGGMNGFLKNPIGHTLGDGGNLSIPDFSQLKWDDFQHAGATDVAVESSVGVLFFQMGVAALAWFAFYFWVAAVAWRLYLETRAPALTFVTSAILVSLANGLFQEEAYFAPFSLAFVMGFCGLILGATDRAVVARIVRSKLGAELWGDQSPSNDWTTPRSRLRSSFTRPNAPE